MDFDITFMNILEFKIWMVTVKALVDVWIVDI
jgi:hypothetical protein